MPHHCRVGPSAYMCSMQYSR